MSRKRKAKPKMEDFTEYLEPSQPEQEPSPAPAPAAPKPKKVPAAKKPESQGASMYIGPSLSESGLMQFTLFKNGQFPAHVLALIEQTPEIQRLIVPVAKLSQHRSNLSNKSSVEYSLFQRVREKKESE